MKIKGIKNTVGIHSRKTPIKSELYGVDMEGKRFLRFFSCKCCKQNKLLSEGYYVAYNEDNDVGKETFLCLDPKTNEISPHTRKDYCAVCHIADTSKRSVDKQYHIKDKEKREEAVKKRMLTHSTSFLLDV